jgi:diadenosine tetraphosphate (Ap4A) HIT family hydrolase
LILGKRKEPHVDKYVRFKIKAFDHWTVYLNESQCYLGRVYIWAREPELVDLMDITDKEQKELFEIGRKLKGALDALYEPDLFNWAALGNITPHCHVHVIPRYASRRERYGMTFVDDRWGKNYTPYNSDFKVPETVLFSIRDEIAFQLS